MPRYSVNEGNRNFAIRLGCERGIYLFINDYAEDMGMSMSSAVRRLVLIGARCEAEHGKARMPATYKRLQTGSKEFNDDIYDAFTRYQTDGEDKDFDWH